MVKEDFDATKFLNGIKAVIIDDDELNVKLIKDTLEVFGIKDVKCAYAGGEAMEYVGSERFDMIISEWKIGDFNGAEFIRDLRENSYSVNRYTPVILITGRGNADEVIEARDAGVTEFILKPFSVKQLREKIIEVIESPRSFVISRKYVGPDRRRKNMEVKEDRRKKNEADNW